MPGTKLPRAFRFQLGLPLIGEKVITWTGTFLCCGIWLELGIEQLLGEIHNKLYIDCLGNFQFSNAINI